MYKRLMFFISILTVVVLAAACAPASPTAAPTSSQPTTSVSNPTSVVPVTGSTSMVPSLAPTQASTEASTMAPASTSMATQASATQPSATQPAAAVSTPSGKPIVIGASLSLSGDFSDDGKAFQQGYQIWADWTNAHGGLLGRPVQVNILSDASSTDQVQTNYQKFINVDKVDLVFGPYSSLLTKPASVVANRYGFAMVEGAGGGPSVFTQGLNNVFDVSLPVANNLDSFAAYLQSLPADQKPASIAYATEDDPFTQPQIDRVRGILEKAGFKTASYQVYPAETTDFNPIADKIISSNADVVVAGTMFPDVVAMVQRFKQQHFNPKAFIATAGPDQGSQFLNAVGGAPSAEGIMVPTGWIPEANTPGNQDMVNAYIAKYGGTADQISADVAEAFAVGQVVAQAVTKVGSLDNAKLIAELHSGDTFDSVQGPVKFDSTGQNVAISAYIFQWQNSKFVPVYPANTIGAVNAEYPKPQWP